VKLEQIVLDFHDAAFVADPYPIYARVRQEAPIHHNESLDMWVVADYRHALSVLSDRRWANDHRHAKDHEEFLAQRAEIGMPDPAGQVLLFMDAPDHTRVRNLARKAFTPAMVQRLRDRVRELVQSLLGKGNKEIELMSELAYPLPVTVIAEMLGVPRDDVGLFRERSRDLIGVLEIDPPIEVLKKAAEGAFALAIYLSNLIEKRRAHPQDDLISSLVEAEEKGDQLSHEELMSLCILLFVAGHETTMNLIGNGTLALVRNADQIERLRADPDLARLAVEELLRYDSPVQLTVRTALVDLDLDGHRVPKGEQVLILLGSANRDPEEFEDPDRLDLGRADNRHMSFGHGSHFCLGAPLARVEGQVFFPMLVEAFERIELAAEPVWRGTTTLRGLRELRLTLN
jgi:cytochrome P450